MQNKTIKTLGQSVKIFLSKQANVVCIINPRTFLVRVDLN